MNIWWYFCVRKKIEKYVFAYFCKKQLDDRPKNNKNGHLWGKELTELRWLKWQQISIIYYFISFWHLKHTKSKNLKQAETNKPIIYRTDNMTTKREKEKQIFQCYLNRTLWLYNLSGIYSKEKREFKEIVSFTQKWKYIVKAKVEKCL